MELLDRYDVAYVLRFFERLGILPKQRDGYWYPNSEQAASVREAFVLRLSELGVPSDAQTHLPGHSQNRPHRLCSPRSHP